MGTAVALQLVLHPHGSIERDPCHDLGVRELPRLPAHLPYPRVLVAPAVLEPCEQLAHERGREHPCRDGISVDAYGRVPSARSAIARSAGRRGAPRSTRPNRTAGSNTSRSSPRGRSGRPSGDRPAARSPRSASSTPPSIRAPTDRPPRSRLSRAAFRIQALDRQASAGSV